MIGLRLTVMLAAALASMGAVGVAATSGAHLELNVTPGKLPPLAEVTVNGTNGSDHPGIVVLRADDRPNAPYADRVGIERIFAPGPFSFSARLGLLATPRGRHLDTGTVSRVLAFTPDSGISLSAITLSPAGSLPEQAQGWFFGPAEAAPLRGFDAVATDDPRVSGPRVLVHRPGTDPVLAYGMRLTRFATKLANGSWRLTLWTEDPGDWETLPPVLERRIIVNGKWIDYERRTWQQWVQDRYLVGRELEADPSQPPYAGLGARRGGRIDAVVQVDDGRLVIDLAGTPSAAINLAAVVAEPAGRQGRAAASVEAARARAFAAAWPVIGSTHPAASVTHAQPAPAVTELTLRRQAQAQAVAAPGGVAFLRFTALSPIAQPARMSVAWANPAAAPETRLLWGMWRWRRPAAAASALHLSAASLRGDIDALTVRPDLPRSIVLAVRLPDDTPAGTSTGSLRLVAGDSAVQVPFTIEVVAAHRPEPAARVGTFLDFAPHLAANPSGMEDARRQAVCDLTTLRWFGLTAVTPALEDPVSTQATAHFIEELQAAEQGFSAPLIAYAPLRHIAMTIGYRAAGEAAARADAAARAAGLYAPVWVVADEPSANGTMESAQKLIAEIRRADPGAVLAAHLNAAPDRVLLKDLALATTAPAFGAEAADIAALRAAGVRPWLYNMARLRLAAGFYLWRSGADGLLQWHARMPSADAFDPTDGREGDVQFLWPTPQVCGTPDIGEELVSLAEGEEDLRWLAWLQQAAIRSPRAQALLGRITTAFPGSWAASVRVDDAALQSFRNEIIALAKDLST